MFEEGGLKQEGGMIDEESGNEVPVGSTREEVRDDIDAKLSEGEFVFPADVTRYIGLEKLMQLRQEAKRGLQKMEAMGQMGNSDEATIDDDMPFGMEDLIIISAEPEDEPQKFADGGMPVDPNTGVYYTGNTGVTMQQPIYQPPVSAQPMPPVSTQPVPTQPTATPTGGYTPLFGTAPQQPQQGVSFGNLMAGTELTYKTYVNAAGDSILIPFIGDNPMYPIPQGYVLSTGLDANGRPIAGNATDTTETDTTKPEEPAPADDGNDEPPVDTRSEFQKAGGWNMDTSGKDGVALQKWIDEANKINTQGNIAAGIIGAINPLMGAAVWAGNAYSKKQILAQIDEKIKQAQGTSMAGQVVALQKIKDDLISGKNKGILGTIVDKITTALGLKPEEKVAAKNNVTSIVDSDTKNKNPKILKSDGFELTPEQLKSAQEEVALAEQTVMEQTAKREEAARKAAAEAQAQNKLNAAAMAAEDAQMQAMLSGKPVEQKTTAAVDSGTIGANTLQEAKDLISKKINTATTKEEMQDGISQSIAFLEGQKDISGIEKDLIPPKSTELEMAQIAANAKSKGTGPDLSALQKPKVVTAADKAASDAAATALKAQNVTKDTITKEQFEKIKDSEDAKKMFNISPEATSIEDVKQETTTTRGITSVSTLGTSLIGAGMELGKSLKTPEADTASARDQLVQDYVTKYLESDMGKSVTDRLVKGEDVSINEIQSYLDQVQQQELLDTGTRTAPETGATAAERDAFYKEKAAREEAERIAREEAARKAAEAAAKKAADAAAAKRAQELAAQKAAVEAANARRRESSSSSNDDPFADLRAASAPVTASGVKADFGGSAAEKTSTAKAVTTGLTSTQKQGGAALDTAMGISGLAKGGLASMKAKKTAKYTKSRGIAARKK